MFGFPAGERMWLDNKPIRFIVPELCTAETGPAAEFSEVDLVRIELITELQLHLTERL